MHVTQANRTTPVAARPGMRRARGFDVQWSNTEIAELARIDYASMKKARLRLRADNHFLFLLLNARPVNIPPTLNDESQ
jgi:hypothetical protein